MDNQLFTLSKIFTERLFRIPDYQRGYAWTERQLKDFWSDLSQLESDRNHYTGVLTLENASPEIYARWDEDGWIIADKSYQPFYVVDGQQRLTTSIVLIQVIVETLDDDQKINHNSREEIQKKFLFDSKDGGISRSYIFGYEKDNPSYEFLKSRVFKEKITSGFLQETIYTKNLENAKSYFTEKVAELSAGEVQALYRKLTQSFLFNIFTISEDVDVCVAFETMNNRGKPLSYLELLKNRLIFLSYKLPEPDSERQKLRRAVNDCWRAIYHNLGKNKDNPLDDDRFLLTHYVVYFGKSLIEKDPGVDDYVKYRRLLRTMRSGYSSDLLERTFIAKNIHEPIGSESRIDLQSIFNYVGSLQDAVESWYKLFNPFDSGYSEEVKVWAEKLNRIGMDAYLPLLLVFFQRVGDEKKLLQFLQAVERNMFLLELGFSFRRPVFIAYPLSVKMALDMWSDPDVSAAADKAIRYVQESTNGLLKEGYAKGLATAFRGSGFYAWDSLRYFLYEYELSIQADSKSSAKKISWIDFNAEIKDFITVEHIYPQKPTDKYWKTRFSDFTSKQKQVLRNSLGNLLPLSKPKNSSLSNKPFDEKAFPSGESKACYRYGSYSEIEVSHYSEWGPVDILQRGLRMLQFMERRWQLPLGDEKSKIAILGLEFVEKKRAVKALRK